MRYLKLIFLCLGLGLLWWVLQQANLSEIWQQVRSISVVGIVAVFIIYAAYFGADVISWQVTLDTIAMNARWAGRLYVVRMIGEAYNNVTPLASMGGEPIKAWLLKTNYGIALRNSGTSLVLAKTASMFSLVIFAGIGCALAFAHDNLTSTHKIIIAAGLGWLVFNVVVFFLMQHLRLSTFTATKIGKTRLGQRLGRLLSGMQEMDEQFAHFYRHQRRHLGLSMFFAMLNWILGVVELYVILSLIGHPVSWSEAWLIEAAVQMIRTVAFFIPAGIGAQEGALMLTCGVITGSPTVGVSAALVRRFRELIWTGASLLLALGYRVGPNLATRVAAASDG
jgi:glycosyltransferase 2 family protein